MAAILQKFNSIFVRAPENLKRLKIFGFLNVKFRIFEKPLNFEKFKKYYFKFLIN